MAKEHSRRDRDCLEQLKGSKRRGQRKQQKEQNAGGGSPHRKFLHIAEPAKERTLSPKPEQIWPLSWEKRHLLSPTEWQLQWKEDS